jgi:hypothetical protein
MVSPGKRREIRLGIDYIVGNWKVSPLMSFQLAEE